MASTMAPSPSNMECCFKNTVDRQMETVINVDKGRIHLCFLDISLFHQARFTPREANTWILGNTLVEVSVLYNITINLEKIFFSGFTGGLMVWPLGNKVQMARQMVIPINKNAVIR